MRAPMRVLVRVHCNAYVNVRNQCTKKQLALMKSENILLGLNFQVCLLRSLQKEKFTGHFNLKQFISAD